MDVLVKNGNGKIVLAVLGLAADIIDINAIVKLPGVAECNKENDFFTENYQSFDEAWHFFNWGY
jgi:hypothetical protein